MGKQANTITGSGFDAIGLYGTTKLSSVIRNNLDGFTTTGPGQIFLGPGMSQNVVQCFSPSDTVFNLGTDNNVVGCTQPAPASPASVQTPRVAIPRP